MKETTGGYGAGVVSGSGGGGFPGRFQGEGSPTQSFLHRYTSPTTTASSSSSSSYSSSSSSSSSCVQFYIRRNTVMCEITAFHEILIDPASHTGWTAEKERREAERMRKERRGGRGGGGGGGGCSSSGHASTTKSTTLFSFTLS
ncbi:unnamed protein product [Pleuronectes platessa]|uniref:Uncharacterized protein n=1 Tax=Pleuronectes platessa TaxID=8262 RepID=A0A9N7TM75_PLEPL|nr:unnamed protein product [Pleuronectes platessa]